MHKHVYGLDLVRAVAIALVVFQHGALFFNLCYGSPVIWTKTGTIGVTLFFALSGYLIGGILLGQGDSLGEFRVAVRFWLRRALRTLPNYFLFILINVVFWNLFQRARGYPSPMRQHLVDAEARHPLGRDKRAVPGGQFPDGFEEQTLLVLCE